MVMTPEAPQGLRTIPRDTQEITPGMSIAQAIVNANAWGGEQTILLYTGVYREGDLNHTGVANITIKSMGLGRTVIAPTVAPAAGVIISGAILSLDGIEVMNPDLTMPALRVTGGTCDCKRCTFDQVGGAGGNVVEMVNGILTLHDCETDLGAIDLRDAACTLVVERSAVNGPIVTAGAGLVMNVTVRHCDCNNQAFNLGATGACSYDFESNNEMGTITDASLGAGAVNGEICRCHVVAGLIKNGTTGWLIDNSEMAAVSNTDATGAITIYGGITLGITRAVGSIVWWLDGNTLKVIPSGTITDTVIQWAVNAAGAGDTVVVHPGTYEEAVTLAAGINLVGIDKEQCIIDIDHATLITMAEGCYVANLTLDVTGDATDIGIGIECNNVNCTIHDLLIYLTVTDNAAFGIIDMMGDGAKTIHIRNVRLYSEDDDTYGIFTDQGNKTFYIENSYFACVNPLSVEAVSTVYSSHNHWDTLLLTGGVAFTIVGGIVYARHDAIIEAIKVSAGIVRLRDCSYREIDRSGTGNIVDESPDLKDAPWHIERWNWQAVLANSQVAVRGGAVDGGSGQVHLPVTDGGAATQSAVEATAEVAGTLGTEFTPAKTPRFITQISVDSFALAATNIKMFFGLRETKGDNVPVANEDHAGFEWDGAAFNAVNCLGANKSTQALATPSPGTHVQLEVIVLGGVQVEFYIDGILVHTETSNVPTAVLDWQHLIEALGNSSGNTVNVTVRNGGTQECPS